MGHFLQEIQYYIHITGFVKIAVEMLKAVQPEAVPLVSRVNYPPLALLLFQSSDWYRKEGRWLGSPVGQHVPCPSLCHSTKTLRTFQLSV